MNQYDQKQMVENIFSVIEREGMKIGEVEKRAGLSAGYLSRMARGEKAAPTAETVWRIAQALGVSLEWLIAGRGMRKNEQAEYLRQFLLRLLDRTQAGQMDWGRVTAWDVSRRLEDGRAEGFPAMEERTDGKKFLTRPVFENVNPKEISMCVSLDGTRRIRPVSRPDAAAVVAGSSFYAELAEGQRIWLIPYLERMAVSDEGEIGNVTWYELVSVDQKQGTVLPVCSTLPGNEMITPEIRTLYMELKMHEGEILIPPQVRPVIDAFMERTAPGGE